MAIGIVGFVTFSLPSPAQQNTPLVRFVGTPHQTFGRIELFGAPEVIFATRCEQTEDESAVVLTLPTDADVDGGNIFPQLAKYVSELRVDEITRQVALNLRADFTVVCMPAVERNGEGVLVVDLLSNETFTAAEVRPSVVQNENDVLIRFAMNEPAYIEDVAIGDVLRITFRQQLRMSLSDLSDRLGPIGVDFPQFRDVRNRVLEIPLAPLYQEYSARATNDGNVATIVLTAPASATRAADELVEVPITLLQTKTSTRFIFNWPVAANADPVHAGNVLTITFSRLGYLTTDLLDTEKAFPSGFGFGNPRSEQIGGAAPRTRFLIDLPQGYNYNTWRQDEQIFLDIEHKSVEQRLVNLSPIREREFSLRPTQNSSDYVGTLGFLLSEGINLAFFEYGGSYWLIFGASFTPNLDQLAEQSKDFVTAVDQLSHPDVTILRFVMPRKLRALITRQLFQWHISFYEDPQPLPAEQIEIVPLSSIESGSDILIALENAGGVATFVEPESGDELHIGLVSEERLGVRNPRTWPDFELHETIQGLLIKEVIPEVTITPHSEGFRVVRTETAGNVGGREAALQGELETDRILLAPLTSRNLTDTTVPLLEIIGRNRVFDEFLDEHAHLTARYGDILESERPSYWFDMMGFYLAEGLGYEAIGTHTTMRIFAPEQAKTLPATLGQYASLILARQYAQADALLQANLTLRNYDETHIWLGLYHAHHLRYRQAELHFQRGDRLLRLYPIPIRKEILPIRTRVAITQNRLLEAEDWLEQISSANLFRPSKRTTQEINLNVALLNLRRENVAAARTQIFEQINSPDLLRSMRAAVYGLPQLYAAGAVEPREAVEVYSHLLFGWSNELLGNQANYAQACFYLLDGDFASGLELFRNLLSLLQQDPTNPQVARNMGQIFSRSVLSPGEYGLSAQEALEIFLRFRELIPAGEEGARLIESLGDRMARIEAYDVAIDLVGNPLYIARHTGIERRRVVLKAALLEMLAGKY
ncbi:MAG: hypothetical protein K0U78_01175, partial [Actinomycetia bacterium]|nr:hypothetical protein [Actinomycetes bacterium]